MKTRKLALIGLLSVALMVSSCVGYGGYGYRPSYYAPRPYVRVLPPPVFMRPPVYYYQPRPNYGYRYHHNYGRNNNRRNYGGRRRW